MEGFKRFRHIDSHFASKQILKGFERSNHRRVKEQNEEKHLQTAFHRLLAFILHTVCFELTTFVPVSRLGICAYHSQLLD